MKRAALVRWRPACCVLQLAVVASAACGGNADMGANVSDLPADATFDGQPASDSTPEIQRVSVVQTFDPDVRSPEAIAVVGEHLYIRVRSPGSEAGLYRCQKDNCRTTLTRIRAPRAPEWYDLRSSGQRLTFLSVSAETRSIGTCAVPDCSDERSVISGLPYPWDEGRDAAWFDLTHVYWHLSEDHAIYRCALPDCAGGPVSVAERLTAWPSFYAASGDFIYWSDEFLYWTRKDGSAAHRAFAPGPELTALVADSEGEPRLPAGFARLGSTRIGLHAGKLYAQVRLKDGCDPFAPDCQATLARWPAQENGAREVVIEQTGLITGVYLFDGELVWTNHSSPSDGRELWSCRVEDCAQSKRVVWQEPFAVGPYTDPHAIADDRYLYWLAGSVTSPAVYDRILRARLLPVPP